MSTGRKPGRKAAVPPNTTRAKQPSPPPRYTTQQFVRLTGVPQRRLRSWTTAGVLPPPEGRGPATRYTETHVLLAKAIERLRSRGVRLRDIPLRLAQLDRSQLVALARSSAEPHGAPPDGTVTPPPAPSYPFSEWQFVNLMPGLVLLVNPSGNPVVARVADEIYRHYSAAGAGSLGV